MTVRTAISKVEKERLTHTALSHVIEELYLQQISWDQISSRGWKSSGAFTKETDWQYGCQVSIEKNRSIAPHELFVIQVAIFLAPSDQDLDYTNAPDETVSLCFKKG